MIRKVCFSTRSGITSLVQRVVERAVERHTSKKTDRLPNYLTQLCRALSHTTQREERPNSILLLCASCPFLFPPSLLLSWSILFSSSPPPPSITSAMAWWWQHQGMDRSPHMPSSSRFSSSSSLSRHFPPPPCSTWCLSYGPFPTPRPSSARSQRKSFHFDAGGKKKRRRKREKTSFLPPCSLWTWKCILSTSERRKERSEKKKDRSSFYLRRRQRSVDRELRALLILTLLETSSKNIPKAFMTLFITSHTHHVDWQYHQLYSSKLISTGSS